MCQSDAHLYYKSSKCTKSDIFSILWRVFLTHFQNKFDENLFPLMVIYINGFFTVQILNFLILKQGYVPPTRPLSTVESSTFTRVCSLLIYKYTRPSQHPCRQRKKRAQSAHCVYIYYTFTALSSTSDFRFQHT